MITIILVIYYTLLMILSIISFMELHTHLFILYCPIIYSIISIHEYSPMDLIYILISHFLYFLILIYLFFTLIQLKIIVIRTVIINFLDEI
jgi:hypothetical protein